MAEQLSYTKNYLFIYLFQALSIIVGFASMLVVVPHLSTQPSIYGIYSICTSITVFLSYADLGFLGAGVKYAAEYYAKNETREEIRVLGFTHFVFFLIVVLISLVFFILGLEPSLLIKNISTELERETARSLLFILAAFSPFVVFQRYVLLIFSVRLQEYKVQRVITIGNIIKIFSVFIFFSNGHYDIIGYYLTFNIINVIITIINLLQVKYSLGIRLIEIIKSFKFDKQVFIKVKYLAYSSFVGSILWVIFYELDSIVISRTLGAEAVAIYAIGLTLLGFIRSLLGIFFTPFNARFNHFIGKGDDASLKKYYSFILQIMFFISVFPIVTVALLAEPIVLSWVGTDYSASVPMVTLLILCNLLAFVQYPAGNLLVAKQNIKAIYITNILSPIVYWLGVVLSMGQLGLLSFATFKFIAFMLLGFVYLGYSLSFLRINIFKYIKLYILPYVPSLLLTIILALLSRHLFYGVKSVWELFKCMLVIAVIIGVSFITSLIFMKPLRDYTNRILCTFKNKFTSLVSREKISDSV